MTKLLLQRLSLILVLSLSTGAAAESWLKAGADRKIGLYLDTDSVRVIEQGIRVSVSVINYSTATGEEQSLLAGTLHDCILGVSKDQFVVQTSEHWAKGEQVAISGEAKSWHPPKRGSMGAALQRVVCNGPIMVP